MENKVIYSSTQEVEMLKNGQRDSKEVFIAEIFGKECFFLEEYFNSVSEAFKFPTIAKGFSGYHDWIRDLSWIEEKEIILIIHDFSLFLGSDSTLKDIIVDDFKQIILPWWDAEVMDCVVGGERRLMKVYLEN